MTYETFIDTCVLNHDKPKQKPFRYRENGLHVDVCFFTKYVFCELPCLSFSPSLYETRYTDVRDLYGILCHIHKYQLFSKQEIRHLFFIENRIDHARVMFGNSFIGRFNNEYDAVLFASNASRFITVGWDYTTDELYKHNISYGKAPWGVDGHILFCPYRAAAFMDYNLVTP